jgi:hypothetical protein
MAKGGKVQKVQTVQKAIRGIAKDPFSSPGRRKRKAIMISNRGNEIESAKGGGQRSPSSVRASKGRENLLFVVRFAGESDVRWRAVNAKNPDEARAQALMISHGDLVDYALVDPESRSIAVLGTIGGA